MAGLTAEATVITGIFGIMIEYLLPEKLSGDLGYSLKGPVHGAFICYLQQFLPLLLIQGAFKLDVASEDV